MLHVFHVVSVLSIFLCVCLSVVLLVLEWNQVWSCWYLSGTRCGPAGNTECVVNGSSRPGPGGADQLGGSSLAEKLIIWLSSSGEA